MKVIHYIPSIDRIAGGTSTYMQVLAKGLGELAEVHIITHASENPLPIENCIIHNVSVYNPINSRFKNEVSKLFDVIKPDLVHVNCCWMPACAFIQQMAQKRNIKVVLTPHGMLEPWIIKRHYRTRKLPALLLYQKAAIQNADCIQSTAESERDNLMKLGYNTNIKIVRLGIDADGIELKKSWKKTRQILFLSRVHVKKGINFLIEAASVLREELKGYKILVAGEGDADYVAAMKQMIGERGLQDIIQLIGGVYGDEKWRLFQSSDFFVLPTHSENFGLAIAESLASGTPVITTVGTPWNDLNETKSGAWIEIGTQPLIDTFRFIDHTPRSRNEKLASLMRRMNMCEERGSGIDRALTQCELYQLPAPDFQKDDLFTKVIMYAPMTLRQMDKEDKRRACYQHCCLQYLSGNKMTNETFRGRLNISDENYSMASRIIADTIAAKYIKPDDGSPSKKYAKYVPIWA